MACKNYAASKADVATIRADIATVRTEIATLRSEMMSALANVRSEMKALTFDITTRMGLLYVTATSFLLAVLKFT